ncbi:hypothetical protein K227x_35070 [Rubripirellula lacrimiformis]|uniref:Uncharacterized protein n=1 Tax=Rubripirellula lacrimiformis TaxID=1930273 RepID=A0A517NDH7_9BACT|nr:hypothetical protein [Rubripirellula lacrimiformis]QDT05108.1 hypothetical protein K227x_35070 [Rubripirellula lacrimiformis]
MTTPDLSQFNFTISIETVADTIKIVQKRTNEERTRRFDDIAAKQGNVMGAAVQLGGLGVSMDLVEHALYVLLVLFEIFEAEAPGLPTVSQETVQAEFDRYAESVKFYEDETPANATHLQTIQWENFSEHAVVAFVVSHLTDHVKGFNRDTEFVRQCCMVMMQSYVRTYRDWLGE